MRQTIQDTTGNTAELLYKRYGLATVIQHEVWQKDVIRYEEHREQLALACVYTLLFKTASNKLKIY